MCLYFATLWSMFQTWSTQPICSTQACKYIFHIWPRSFLKAAVAFMPPLLNTKEILFRWSNNQFRNNFPETWFVTRFWAKNTFTWSKQTNNSVRKNSRNSRIPSQILDSGSCEQDKSRLKVRSFWSKMHNRYIRHKPVKSLYNMKLYCNIRFKTIAKFIWVSWSSP